MLINKRKIYDILPEFTKEALGVVFRRMPRYKYSPTKEKKLYYRNLKESEWMSADQLKEIQLSKLSRLLNHAYHYVPYYRRVFEERCIKPSDIDTIEKLQKLPLLTKDVIRANPEDFISNTITDRSRLKKVTTSGSTGTPMKFFFDDHALGVRGAHWWRWSEWAGVDLYEDRMVYCAGSPDRWLYPPERTRGTVSITRDRLTLYSANMSDVVLDWYIEDIHRFRGDYIRAQASGVYMLATRILEKKLVIPMKAVLTSSDTLFRHYRSVIESAFDCKVYDFYGQTEDSLTATECGEHDGFHINMESCIAETVDTDGNVVTNTEGRLVSTQLENFAMPLVRYVVGDVGILGTFSQKCTCGRSHQKLTSFIGREGDIIITPEGRHVGCTCMANPTEKMHSSIKCCQFIQEEIGLLRIKVVPTVQWDDRVHRKELEEKTRKEVGDSITIGIELVERIPSGPRGKYKFIVSKVKKDCP